MILDFAGCVGHDAFEDFAETDDFDFEAGFFHYLTEEGFFEGFAAFNGTTREAPKTLEGLIAALHKQDAVFIKDQRADTQDGFCRIAPNVEFYSYSVVTPLTFILAR